MHFVYENCGFVAWNSAEIEFISIHFSKFWIVFIYFSIINAYSRVSKCQITPPPPCFLIFWLFISIHILAWHFCDTLFMFNLSKVLKTTVSKLIVKLIVFLTIIFNTLYVFNWVNQFHSFLTEQYLVQKFSMLSIFFDNLNQSGYKILQSLVSSEVL